MFDMSKMPQIIIKVPAPIINVSHLKSVIIVLNV